MSVNGSIEIYTDGSWVPSKPDRIGAGGCVIIGGNLASIFSFESTDPDLTPHRQIGGEVFSCLYLLQFIDSVITERKDGWVVTVYHDYIGVAHWATGKWKANKPMTAIYKREAGKVIHSLRGKGIEVRFEHVAGHSGDKYNDLADKVAGGNLGALTKEQRDMYDGNIRFKIDKLCNNITFLEDSE